MQESSLNELGAHLTKRGGGSLIEHLLLLLLLLFLVKDWRLEMDKAGGLRQVLPDRLTRCAMRHGSSLAWERGVRISQRPWRPERDWPAFR